MADEADIAQELDERHLADALHKARLKINTNKESEWFCVDCDEVIPHKRRALGGVSRCVDCQSLFEKKGDRK